MGITWWLWIRILRLVTVSRLKPQNTPTDNSGPGIGGHRLAGYRNLRSGLCSAARKSSLPAIVKGGPISNLHVQTSVASWLDWVIASRIRAWFIHRRLRCMQAPPQIALCSVVNYPRLSRICLGATGEMILVGPAGAYMWVTWLELTLIDWIVQGVLFKIVDEYVIRRWSLWASALP